MRAQREEHGYAVMGVGPAVVRWPDVIGYDRSKPLYAGVTVLLTAMSLLALLGLRCPVRMLPILLVECPWTVIWLSVVALPAVVARASRLIDRPGITTPVTRCGDPRSPPPLLAFAHRRDRGARDERLTGRPC